MSDDGISRIKSTQHVDKPIPEEDVMPDLADTAYENISDSNFESAMNSDTSENEDVSNDEGKGQQRNLL